MFSVYMEKEIGLSLNNEKTGGSFPPVFLLGFISGRETRPLRLFLSLFVEEGFPLLFTVCRGYLTEDGLFSFYASTKSAYTDIFPYRRFCSFTQSSSFSINLPQGRPRASNPESSELISKRSVLFSPFPFLTRKKVRRSGTSV